MKRRRKTIESKRDKPSSVSAQPPRHIPQRRAQKKPAGEKRNPRKPAPVGRGIAVKVCGQTSSGAAETMESNGECSVSKPCRRRETDLQRHCPRYPETEPPATPRPCHCFHPSLMRTASGPSGLLRASATRHAPATRPAPESKAASSPARNCGRPKRSRVKYGRIRSSRVFYHVGGGLRESCAMSGSSKSMSELSEHGSPPAPSRLRPSHPVPTLPSRPSLPTPAPCFWARKDCAPAGDSRSIWPCSCRCKSLAVDLAWSRESSAPAACGR